MLAKCPEISREICQKKTMKFLSHVLVMYDCHILFSILCIGSVRNKHVKRVLHNHLGVLVCTADTCMYYVEY